MVFGKFFSFKNVKSERFVQDSFRIIQSVNRVFHVILDVWIFVICNSSDGFNDIELLILVNVRIGFDIFFEQALMKTIQTCRFFVNSFQVNDSNDGGQEEFQTLKSVEI